VVEKKKKTTLRAIILFGTGRDRAIRTTYEYGIVFVANLFCDRNEQQRLIGKKNSTVLNLSEKKTKNIENTACQRR
jgi:hypothetical protein